MVPPSNLFEHEQVFAEFVWIFSVFKAKLAVEIDCSGVCGLHLSVEVGEMSSDRPHKQKECVVRDPLLFRSSQNTNKHIGA